MEEQQQKKGLGVPVAKPTVGLRAAILRFAQGFTPFALTRPVLKPYLHGQPECPSLAVGDALYAVIDNEPLDYIAGFCGMDMTYAKKGSTKRWKIKEVYGPCDLLLEHKSDRTLTKYLSWSDGNLVTINSTLAHSRILIRFFYVAPMPSRSCITLHIRDPMSTVPTRPALNLEPGEAVLKEEHFRNPATDEYEYYGRIEVGKNRICTFDEDCEDAPAIYLDAHNTYNKTFLLPSELAEQLEEALTHLSQMFEGFDFESGLGKPEAADAENAWNFLLSHTNVRTSPTDPTPPEK